MILFLLILYFGIPCKTLCLLLTSLHKLLFSHASGRTVYSQERLRNTTYAKFWGQAERIMGDSKIVFRVRICQARQWSGNGDGSKCASEHVRSQSWF